MTAGLTTWDALGRLEGKVLAILTSPPAAPDELTALFNVLAACADPAAIYVIGDPAWRGALEARGVTSDRTLLTGQDPGAALELNHFLETPAVVRWAVTHRFSTIVGSAAHNRHNEEVKEIFERRVSLLLGDGVFLAHTLPGPYVYRLDLAALIHRFDRGPEVAAYTAASRALIDDLYGVWRAQGSPATSDDPRFDDVLPPLTRHLDPRVFALDDPSPVPIAANDRGSGLVAFLTHVRQVIAERDEQVAALREAVGVRDRIIDELQRNRQTLLERLRRRWRHARNRPNTGSAS